MRRVITVAVIAPPTGPRWDSLRAAAAWIAAARRKGYASTSSCFRSTAIGESACAIRPDLCQGVSMNLLGTYDNLLQEWRPVFSQDRIFARARRLTFGLLVCLRLHPTSRAICATGRQFVDWSADYRLRPRRPWNPHQLFDPIFDRLPALLASPSAPVIAALDDTLCKKTGRHIPGVGMARDPMSPAFHVNLCYGLRFVQVSLLVRPIQAPGAARALPVRFDFAPPACKPKKNAAPEVHQAYKKEKKQRTLALAGVAAIRSVRQSLDERAETAQRQLITSGDGSYTNKAVLR